MFPLSNSDINEPATNGQKVGNFSHYSNICILRVDEFDRNQLNFSFKTEKKKKKYSRTTFLAKKLIQKPYLRTSAGLYFLNENLCWFPSNPCEEWLCLSGQNPYLTSNVVRLQHSMIFVLRLEDSMFTSTRCRFVAVSQVKMYWINKWAHLRPLPSLSNHFE